MGDYRIIIDAVGDHGCQREADDGKAIYGCGRMGCVDCQTREFVDQLKRRGSSIQSAVLEHWPKVQQNGFVREDEHVGPIDDIARGTRRGSFKTKPMLPAPAPDEPAPR